MQNICVLIANKLGFPGGSDGKESACSAGDPGLIAGSGRAMKLQVEREPPSSFQKRVTATVKLGEWRYRSFIPG